MKTMSYETRTEYIMVQQRRYKRAGKPYKTRLLDEVCEVCGYERKHAIKLLNGSLKPSCRKRGRKGEYAEPEFVKALKTLWLRSGQLCGKRLRPAIPHWLEHYEKHYSTLSDSCHEKLLRISPASIDRVLKPFKAQYRRRCNTGTKPGTLLKNQIPIRTSTEAPGIPQAIRSAVLQGCSADKTLSDITWEKFSATSSWRFKNAPWITKGPTLIG